MYTIRKKNEKVYNNLKKFAVYLIENLKAKSIGKTVAFIYSFYDRCGGIVHTQAERLTGQKSHILTCVEL